MNIRGLLQINKEGIILTSDNKKLKDVLETNDNLGLVLRIKLMKDISIELSNSAKAYTYNMSKKCVYEDKNRKIYQGKLICIFSKEFIYTSDKLTTKYADKIKETIEKCNHQFNCIFKLISKVKHLKIPMIYLQNSQTLLIFDKKEPNMIDDIPLIISDNYGKLGF